MQAMHQKYRPDIDGLRAIAVLCVVGFHSFPSIVKGGFVGVDVFFVISGFLISSIIFGDLEKARFSYPDFYSRRIRRIFPALILVFTACLAFGWFALPPSDYKQLGKHIASGAAFVSNFALWGESGYFDSSADTKPLLHLWSLGIEEQFYIVWPLLLGIVWKRKWNFLALTLAIGIASFAANVFTIKTDPVAAFYSPLCRAWELMVGGILAYLTLHRPQHLPRRSNWQSAVGLALLTISVLILNKQSPFPGWWALLPTCGAFLLISAGPEAILNKYLLSNRVLVWVGLISYPLYLWHWPVLYAINNYQFVSPSASAKAFWTIKVIGVLACFVLSFVTYRFVERPIRFSKQPATARLLAGALAVFFLVGIALVISNGFDARYPEQMREILSLKFDLNEVAYRRNTCFLEPTSDKSKFSDCTTTPATAKRSILLWGDSHAAHLYPGLKAVVGATTGLTQLNTGNCPPILGHDIEGSPNCKLNNDFVAETIRTGKPDVVILSAGWVRYDYWREIVSTIKALKAEGIKQIVLVGPAPQWSASLPRQLFEDYRLSKSSVVPVRLATGLDSKILPLDIEMAAFADELGIKYVSLYKILCNEQGCLTRLGPNAYDLTSFDYDHLTTIGSTYVISHFPRWFFSALELEAPIHKPSPN